MKNSNLVRFKRQLKTVQIQIIFSLNFKMKLNFLGFLFETLHFMLRRSVEKRKL